MPRSMHELQSRIHTALKLGRRIYIHCRAGIGRTGVVVGCYLVEEGLDGRTALKRLNELWRQSERSVSWPVVPQTDEQTGLHPRLARSSKASPGGSRTAPPLALIFAPRGASRAIRWAQSAGLCPLTNVRDTNDGMFGWSVPRVGGGAQ